MQVHVINLESSVGRRTAIAQRLSELGIDFTIVPAVQGRAGYGLFESCDSWQYWLNTGRSPSDGEIGCYASHLQAWQRCAAMGEPLVVMEDDAEPLPTLAAALDVARKVIDRYGFLRFEYDGPGQPARTREVESADEFSIHYFAKYPYGAMCYALTPEVARTFIEHSRVVRAPVDQFIKRCWEHGQPLYGLLPYSVKEGPDALASTIRHRDKPLTGAFQRTRRGMHKLKTWVQRAVFNQRWTQPPFGQASPE